MKEVDVLIYFEHVSRELDSCFRLRYELEKLGLSARVVPVHRNRYRNVVRFRPRMLVLPFVFADGNDRTLEYFKAAYGDLECLNLHHEQFYNEATKSHCMPKNDESRYVHHLAWTEAFAGDLAESGVPEDKIMVCGNPRTDNYYLKPSPMVAAYREGYKKLVFIPTSFSWVFIDEDFFIKNAKLDPEKFRAQKAPIVKTVPLFFRTVRDSAARNPDIRYILRPHPYEDIEKYTRALEESKQGPIEKNIEVIRDGNVYDWIKVSDLVIGWFTTVSMESELFGRRNFVYQPVKLEDWMQVEFIKLYDEIVDDPERFHRIVEGMDDYKPDNARLAAFVKESFGTADGKVNARIARNIANILRDQVPAGTGRSKKLYREIRRNRYKVDLPKNALIRCGLISRYNDIFSGLKEDLVSNRQIEKKYVEFLNRIEK